MSDRFTTLPLGPWPLGMANAMRDTETPPDALRDALNVNIRRDGTAATRVTWDQVLPESSSSLFSHKGVSYAVIGGDLCRLDEAGATVIHPNSGPVVWDVLNGDPLFATRNVVYAILENVVTPLAQPRSNDFGPLDNPDGPHPVAEMPGGHWIAYWNGRIMVARGKSLLFSEPLRFGTHNPLTGYITLPSRAQWLVALEEGFYVGLRDSVWFYKGRELHDLQRFEVAGKSAPGMGLAVPSEYFSGQLADFPKLAVFFTPSGFAIGTPRGDVLYPQAERLKGLPLFKGRLMRDGGRIFAVRGD